jgi:hypothetical protein
MRTVELDLDRNEDIGKNWEQNMTAFPNTSFPDHCMLPLDQYSENGVFYTQ